MKRQSNEHRKSKIGVALKIQKSEIARSTEVQTRILRACELSDIAMRLRRAKVKN